MTKEDYRHPIAPPPWRVQEWGEEAARRQYTGSETDQHIAVEAAQWGADVELKACCDWLHWQNLATHQDLIPSLRAARRPKPPSLKEQALEAMRRNYNPDNSDDFATIRRALEQLDD